jgi:hypothetical protein
MMKFNIINAALIQTLGENELGRYRTIGYQVQTKLSADFVGTDRAVQVFYESGEFPEVGDKSSGDIQHIISYRLEFTVSSKSSVDSDVLKDPDSTKEEKAAAIAAGEISGQIADDSMNELFEIIFGILKSNANRDLGQEPGIFDKLRIPSFRKDDLIDNGSLATLTASAIITMKANEDVSGVEPVVINSISTTTDINGAGDIAGTENIPN